VGGVCQGWSKPIGTIGILPGTSGTYRHRGIGELGGGSGGSGGSG